MFDVIVSICRCAEFLQCRCKDVGGASARDSALFRRALHTICGPLLAEDSACISDAESVAGHLSRITDAYILLKTEKYLSEQKRSRLSEPPSDTVLFAHCFRSYIVSASFFSFSNTFNAWKPFLVLTFRARNCAARAFFVRLFALSLCAADDFDSPEWVLQSAIPVTWQGCFSSQDSKVISLPSAYAVSLLELGNPNKPPSQSSTASSNPYEKRLAGYAVSTTISSQYGEYHAECQNKLQVLRKYLLTCDTVWTEQKLDVGISTHVELFQIALTSTRMDVIVDFISLMLTSSQDSKHNKDIMVDLRDLSLVICHINCLRLILVMLGDAVGAVMGDIQEPVSAAMRVCVDGVLFCGSNVIQTEMLARSDTSRVVLGKEILITWRDAVASAIDLVITMSATDTITTIDFSAKFAEMHHNCTVFGNCIVSMTHKDSQLYREWYRQACMIEEKVIGDKHACVRMLPCDQSSRLVQFQKLEFAHL